VEESTRTLRSGFLRSRERFGSRPALEVDGLRLSYDELARHAASLAATLEREGADEGPPLVAVFAQRSATAFAAVLGALFRGHGYVPLNPSFPVARTREMLARSGCRAVIVDAEAAGGLDALLAGVERRVLWILPDAADTSGLAARWPAHAFAGARDLAPAEAWRPGPVDPDAIAYLLFTSGSTGAPKGVMVAHRNATHFVDAMVARYDVRETDRFSQLFDLTFDLSAFDMFVAWERGACVCCPSQAEKLVPTSYANDARLTIWFSVPSTGVVLSRLRRLKPGAYPGLRLSLFCGEALPVELVERWAEAAPSSAIENLYGPTELTIACTLYAWDAARSPREAEQGLVPIGAPLPGMTAIVVDEALAEVGPGETGELLMSGPQLSLGYWQDPERTAAAFVVPPGRREHFYRTGDRVRRPVGDGPLRFLGRVDHQIKVQGYRVELGEIEAALREEAGVEVAVALGWPVTAKGAEGIVAFLAAPDADPAALRARLRARLPAYMVPAEIHRIPAFPLNANGKVDRGALRERLAGDALRARPDA
jgi:amino acid adenylation domain-containing protein